MSPMTSHTLDDAVNTVHVHDLEVVDNLCVRGRRLVLFPRRERNDAERSARITHYISYSMI